MRLITGAMKMKKALVCFPFKEEDTKVFIKNIKEALSCKHVGGVLCAGYDKGKTYKEIKSLISKLGKDKDRVNIIIQKKLGNKRNGKGNGMNTAVQYFIDKTSYGTIHFYDADIMSFDKSWINQTQLKINAGYDVVRCYFARAYTDAMITWNITKCGLAHIWPDNILSEIEQPLGGELAFTRKVGKKLLASPMVINASGWSIDTAYTLCFCKNKFSMYESYIKQGKMHKLYGALSDLRTMLLECFLILKEQQLLRIDTKGMKYKKDKISVIPKAIKEKMAYDKEGTIKLFRKNWSTREKELLGYFPEIIQKGVMKVLNSKTNNNFDFMTPENWNICYQLFLKYYNENDKYWQDLIFHLWMTRVLNHTSTFAKKGKGYYPAMKNLDQMVKNFRKKSLILNGDI